MPFKIKYSAEKKEEIVLNYPNGFIDFVKQLEYMASIMEVSKPGLDYIKQMVS